MENTVYCQPPNWVTIYFKYSCNIWVFIHLRIGLSLYQLFGTPLISVFKLQKNRLARVSMTYIYVADAK